jgi:hypothetical protein
MPPDSRPSTPASVIALYQPRHDAIEAFAAWQQRLNQAASSYPGFIDSDIAPAADSGSGAWIIIYRFDSRNQLAAWIASDVRSDLLQEGNDYLTSPPELFLNQDGGPGHGPTGAASLTVTHSVREGREDDFRTFQEQMRGAQETFPGFLSVEQFPPIPGVQESWTTIVRFDSQRNLDAWMHSRNRAKILHLSEDIFEDLRASTSHGGFDGWFRFGQDPRHVDEVPPTWKQSLAILLGLYPTVMILTLLVTEHLGLDLPTGMLVGNALSVAALSWLTMPLVNRLLSFWMKPSATVSRASLWLGIGLIVLLLGASYLLFLWLTPILVPSSPS